MSRNALSWALTLCVLCGCQGFRDFLRDPGGDDRIFAGDPAEFVDKEVIVQFRWGDPRVYGEAIPCIVLEVEEDAILVHALDMHAVGYEHSYARLQDLGKLRPVAGQPEVFRIPRDEISRIFERTEVQPEG